MLAADPPPSERAWTPAKADALAADMDKRRLAKIPARKLPRSFTDPPCFTPAAQTSIAQELSRVSHGRVTNWFSTLRPRLLELGYIEIVRTEDGKCIGDRITAAGKAAHRRGER